MQQALMPCPDFEDRLLDYAELSPANRAPVDRHIAACPACRDHLATLEHMDQSLTSLLSSAHPSPDFAARVTALPVTAGLLTGPRMLPELLDMAGWSAIIAILSLVALYFSAPSISVLAVGATAAVAAAVTLSLRSFADLKE